MGYTISSDGDGLSYFDWAERPPLTVVPISSIKPKNFKEIVEETRPIENKSSKMVCFYLGRGLSETSSLPPKLRCCNCGHLSVTQEPLIDISLEIEGVDSVPAALESFTKIEKIKYSCERCKTQGPFEKYLLVHYAPSVAALHLKRFKNNGIVV
ncbi:ubiquitin carboxyl-terminal hydrolase 20-like [Solanum tuberosum]|uniref:ubiquitin carboxyl-terminal hydrolase 20-like n=1 Tax=Solanum tuberosum TaxID=4113 RepID=UPI00073A4657|nr:PREDICTED: ubiquitin carboxyl-terminal hydrolase 20-like [Solanum tuberosum]